MFWLPQLLLTFSDSCYLANPVKERRVVRARKCKCACIMYKLFHTWDLNVNDYVINGVSHRRSLNFMFLLLSIFHSTHVP